MEEIEELAKNLYHPPIEAGFTTIVMIETILMYYPYSENRAEAIQRGVLQAKTYHYDEKRRGVKVYVYDRSTGTLEEIDFTKFH